MSKFVNAVLAQKSGEVTPDQAAALQALESAKQRGSETIGATAVETLKLPSEAVAQPTPTGSPEQLAQVQAAGPIALDETSPEGVRPLTPEETQRDYQEQIEREQQAQVFNPEAQALYIPNVGTARNNEGMAKIQHDIGRMGNALSGVAGSRSRQGAGAYATAPPAALGAIQKLGLSNPEGTNFSSAAGGAAYLAAMIAIEKLRGQSSDIEKDLVARDNPEAEVTAQSGDNIGRFALAKTISDVLQQMVVPSETINQETGVASAAGYSPPADKALGEGEAVALGDMILNGMEATGMTHADKSDPDHDTTAYLNKKYVGNAKARKYEYQLTKAGLDALTKMASVLEAIDPTLKRPVSKVPLFEGRYVGGQARGQKARTKVPLEESSALTPIMKNAMSVMGETPNIVSNHKLDMTEIMFKDVMEKKAALSKAAKQAVNYDTKLKAIRGDKDKNDPFTPEEIQALEVLAQEVDKKKKEFAPEIESPFASMFNQDHKGFMNLMNASIAEKSIKTAPEYKGGQWVKDDGTPYADQADINESWKKEHGDTAPEEGATASHTMTLSRDDGTNHRKFATSVQKAAAEKVKKTIKDANNNKDSVFYYGATGIGNSGRLMISQTELNYQADKLSRFLVDPPRPTMWNKGKNPSKERAFYYVLARGMMDGADKVTPDKLIEKFRNALPDIGPLAEAFYNAQGNPEALSRVMKEVKQKAELLGLAHEWSVKDEWGFLLDGLHDLGKYRQLEDGAQMSTRVKAEADGINNGSSIQAMQFGTKSVLERAGVIFDPDTGNVLPDGTMRDMIFQTMNAQGGDGYVNGAQNLKDPEDKERLGALLKKIKEVGEVKDLVKIPLMTTVYGKPYQSHGQHVKEYVAQKADKLGIALDDVNDAADLLKAAVQTGLQIALTEELYHQEVVKQTAGWFWNMMDIIPEIEGANGYMWQAGGYVYEHAQGEGIDIQGRAQLKYNAIDEQGFQIKGQRVASTIDIQEKRPTATAAKAPEKRWNKATKRMEPQEPSIGNITRNQMAVNGTHNIDSTIAQLTLIRAAKEIPNFWGQQVFDAFIGDVNSFDELIKIGNRTFAQVNQEYSMVEKEKEALQRDLTKFKKELRDRNAPFDVSKEGTHSGVFAFVKRMSGPKGGKRWKTGKDAAIAKFTKLGFQFDEKGKLIEADYTLDPHEMLQLLEYAEKNLVVDGTDLNVMEAFSDMERRIKANKKELAKNPLYQLEFLRQFN